MAGNALNPKGRELPRLVLTQSDTTDPLREFEITVSELFRLVKRSTGRTIFVRSGWFARSIDQNGVEAGKSRGWEITGNVEVPKRVALHFLENAYSEKARNLAYAKITFSNTCLFIEARQMTKIAVVLVGSHGMDLDNVPLNVHDAEDCSREVLAAVTREKWVLSVGDRIEIRTPGTEG